MVETDTAVLSVVRTLVLILGLLIAYFAYKAYRRTGERHLRDAAIGFTIVAIGVFIEGVLFEFLDWELVTVHIIESVIIAIGFAVILYSFIE